MKTTPICSNCGRLTSEHTTLEAKTCFVEICQGKKGIGDPESITAAVNLLLDRLDHIANELHDLVEALGPRKMGDPGWVLNEVVDALEKIAEAR